MSSLRRSLFSCSDFSFFLLQLEIFQETHDDDLPRQARDKTEKEGSKGKAWRFFAHRSKRWLRRFRACEEVGCETLPPVSRSKPCFAETGSGRVRGKLNLIQNGAVSHSERCASAAHGSLHTGRPIDAGEETKRLLFGSTTLECAKNGSFCQDRLGTNIGKGLKQESFLTRVQVDNPKVSLTAAQVRKNRARKSTWPFFSVLSKNPFCDCQQYLAKTGSGPTC